MNVINPEKRYADNVWAFHKYSSVPTRKVISQYNSKISRMMLAMISNPDLDLSQLPDSLAKQFAAEIDEFIDSVWWRLGDKEFNRCGLRNVSTYLIEYLKSLDYYPITPETGTQETQE